MPCCWWHGTAAACMNSGRGGRVSRRAASIGMPASLLTTPRTSPGSAAQVADTFYPVLLQLAGAGGRGHRQPAAGAGGGQRRAAGRPHRRPVRLHQRQVRLRWGGRSCYSRCIHIEQYCHSRLHMLTPLHTRSPLPCQHDPDVGSVGTVLSVSQND